MVEPSQLYILPVSVGTVAFDHTLLGEDVLSSPLRVPRISASPLFSAMLSLAYQCHLKSVSSLWSYWTYKSQTRSSDIDMLLSQSCAYDSSRVGFSDILDA